MIRRVLLSCVVMISFCFGGYAAVPSDGEKIDYNSKIANELKKSEIDYKLLQNYIDNSPDGISDEQIDDLYLRVFRGVCVNGNRKEEEFEKIQNIIPWQYNYSERFLHDVAGVATFRDDRIDIGVCVLSMVSKYKIAGIEFLDVALNVAREYDAENFENTIIQIKQEIINKQTNV